MSPIFSKSGKRAGGRRRRQGPPARFPDLEKIGDIYVCQNNFFVLLMCYTAFLRVTKTDTQRDDRYPAPIFLIGSCTATQLSARPSTAHMSKLSFRLTTL